MKQQNLIKQILNNKKIKKIYKNFDRTYIIALFFIFFSLSIIWKMFSYTVINYDFYKKLADKQQIWEVVVPVTRWTIYLWWERETILGTSLNLYNLAIDPKMKWDKTKLSLFLTDIIYMQLCKNKSDELCKNNLTKFLRVLDIEDFDNNEYFIKKLILDRINKKLSSTRVTSIFIDYKLDNEEITKVINLWLEWIYIRWNYIYANPEEINNLPVVADKLSNILPYTKKKIEYLLRKRDIRYIPIINKLSIDVSEYIKNYLSDEKEALNKWILDIDKSISKFFILTPVPNRYYPEWNLASQVIWFVDNDWNWHYWIEWRFNDILKWNNWKIISRKDIKWRIIDPITLNTDKLSWEWSDIVTTIDRNIQKKVEELLEAWVKKYRANKWTVVVMNPKTGDIVAMANYPSYNINNYGDVYEIEKVRYSKYPDPKIDLLGYPVFVEDKANWKKFFYDNKEIYLRKATREELWDVTLVKYKYKNWFWAGVYKNDAISSLYEPGSIMKWITVAIWLDTWEINKYSMYTDKWEVNIDEFTIKNVSKKCLWYHSFGHALNYSCNIWMIRIVQKVWKVLKHQYLNDFWFGSITGIDLEWEVFAKIKPWEMWSKAQLLTSSYWLWVSVTPLQMAAAYSVLANWWIYIKPKIIDKIKFPDGRVLKYKKEEVRRVIKKSTSDTIKEMLVDSAANWLASNWNIDWYSVAWKTWTSQIPYKWKYEKWQWSTIWSYAWFGPAEDPKFVIIVKLVRPRLWSWYGWATSAYIFKDIASYLFDYYWIPKRETKK